MSNLIIAAAQYARHAHIGQTRMDGSPYIIHPMRVAGRISMLQGVDEHDVAAGWLHDVIEDCSRPSFYTQDISNIFGKTVANLCLGLTNPSQIDVNLVQLSRAERKKADFDHIANQSHRVQRIKLVDRLDNLYDVGDKSRIKWLKRYVAESYDLLKYISPAVDTVLHQRIRDRLKNIEENMWRYAKNA